MHEPLPAPAATETPTDAPDGARPEPSLRVDADGRVTRADAAAVRLLADVDEDLVGRPLERVVEIESRPLLDELLRTAPGAPASRADVRLSGAGDRRIDAEVLVVAFDAPDGDGATHALHVRDMRGKALAARLRRCDAAVIDAFARGASPAAAATSLLTSLASALGARSAGYYAARPDDSLERVAIHGDEAADADELLPERLAPADTIAGRALRSRQPLWAAPGQAGAALTAGHAVLAVPLGAAGEIGAVAVLVDPAGGEPGARVRAEIGETGARAGELLAVLVERHARIDTLARLALTDELTGLPNRRAWEEMLARELARAARDRTPVCVAVLDLDGFKAYNDANGHQAGDRLLREAAGAWQRQLRLSDLLARYGGEEFAAVIPAWPMEIATAVVERVRAATPGGLTASAGIASWTGAETGAELFGRADAALYAAKQAGRDRTVLAEEPGTGADSSPVSRATSPTRSARDPDRARPARPSRATSGG